MLLSLLLFSSQKVKPDLVIPLPRVASDVVWSPNGKSLYIGDDKGVTEWPSGRFVKADGKELLFNSSKTKLIFTDVEGHELTLLDLKTFRQQTIRKDYKRAWWWGDKLVWLRAAEPHQEYEKSFAEVDGKKIRLPESLWVTCGDGPILMAKEHGDKGGFVLYRFNLRTGKVSKILKQSYPNEEEYSGLDNVFWEESRKRAFVCWTASTAGSLKRFSYIPGIIHLTDSFVEGGVHKSHDRIVFMEREFGSVDKNEADFYRLNVQDGKSRNWKVLASWTNVLVKDRSELPWYSHACLSEDGRRVVWQETINGRSKLVVRDIDVQR